MIRRAPAAWQSMDAIDDPSIHPPGSHQDSFPALHSSAASAVLRFLPMDAGEGEGDVRCDQ